MASVGRSRRSRRASWASAGCRRRRRARPSAPRHTESWVAGQGARDERRLLAVETPLRVAGGRAEDAEPRAHLWRHPVHPQVRGDAGPVQQGRRTTPWSRRRRAGGPSSPCKLRHRPEELEAWSIRCAPRSWRIPPPSAGAALGLPVPKPSGRHHSNRDSKVRTSPSARRRSFEASGSRRPTGGSGRP